jgi:LemA protein
MKGRLIVSGLVVIAIIFIAIFATLYFTTYNNIVGLNASVESAWSNVDVQLQRRYDLIPSVVAAARAYMTYEGSILQNITALRSQWINAEQNGNLDDINSATSSMESGLSSLIVTFEAYPSLQSSDVVQSLMITLEGTENRISTERIRYNDAVRDFNTAVHVFPANLWTNGWGYTTKAYFQAQVGSTEVPSVDL